MPNEEKKHFLALPGIELLFHRLETHSLKATPTELTSNFTTTLLPIHYLLSSCNLTKFGVILVVVFHGPAAPFVWNSPLLCITRGPAPPMVRHKCGSPCCARVL
jgi:hypothetical protein